MEKTSFATTVAANEQRKIANLILKDSVNSAAALYRTFFRKPGSSLIWFSERVCIPVPNALKSAAEIALAINYNRRWIDRNWTSK